MGAPSRGSCTQKIPRTLANGELTMYWHPDHGKENTIPASSLSSIYSEKAKINNSLSLVKTFSTTAGLMIR